MKHTHTPQTNALARHGALNESFAASVDPTYGEVVEQPDVLGLLLADKRSLATRRAYEFNLKLFFNSSQRLSEPWASDPRAALLEFLRWSAPAIGIELAQFKGRQIAAGYAEATVNQRLYAVQSLLKWAWKRGLCATDGRGLIEGERVRQYRDTRGVDAPAMKRMCEAPRERGISTKGKKQAQKELRGFDLKTARDIAILRLLCENGLRRAEVLALNVEDLRIEERRIFIKGKGRGSQKEPIDITGDTAQLIANYLLLAGHYGDGKAPLFRSCDHRTDLQNKRLSPSGIYKVVKTYGAQIGVPTLTPHKLRHSAITLVANETKGDLSQVRKFSRHADANTVLKYIDNAENTQGKLTQLIADALQ